ncbi:MAG: acyl--CoA ligase [Candidatus Tectomicrobia bacterium]|nr:acyl--CoA ligase [Candidatus Tectomicrobia bacterium]
MNLQEVEDLTLAQVVERNAARRPEKVALLAGARRVTYRDLVAMAHAVAAGLAARGVRKGDRVAIALLNTPEMVAAYLGCAQLGAVIVWANPAYRHDDLRFVLSNTRANAILAPRQAGDFNFLGMVQELRRELPDLSLIVAESGETAADLSLEALITSHLGEPAPAVEIDVHADILYLQHTSGTTGVPKAAVHTNAQQVRNVVAVMNSYRGTEEDVYLGHLPFYHTFGRTCILDVALMSGAACVLQEAFQPAESLRLMAEHRVTIQHCAPTHLILELNVPDFPRYDLSALRTGYVAGFVCPVETFKRACAAMGCHYLGAWGSSESIVGFASDYERDTLEQRATTVGQPLEGFEFKIIDEAGASLPPGRDGELCVRSYSVLPFYWENPAETARQLDADGWLRMGDLAVVGEAQRLRILGRLKEVVNRGGMKIYPSELETLLDKHPKVREVCIIATPNPVLGENVCACIVPGGGDKPKLAELRAYLAEHVARYKLPDELCLFEEFPRLSGGVKLRKFGAGGIQEMAMKNEKRERWR